MNKRNLLESASGLAWSLLWGIAIAMLAFVAVHLGRRDETPETATAPVVRPASPIAQDGPVTPPPATDTVAVVQEPVAPVEDPAARRNALLEYLALMEPTFDDLRAGRSAQAETRAREWVAAHAHQASARQVSDEPDRIRRAGQALKPLLDHPAAIRGIALSLGAGVATEVDGLRDGQLQVFARREEGRIGMAVPLASLGDNAVGTLLKAADPTNFPVNWPVYLLARVQPQRALDSLQMNDASADDSEVEAWARDWRAAERNIAARKSIDQARALLTAGRAREAQSVLQRATGEYADTDIIQWAMNQEVAALAGEIGAKLTTVAVAPAAAAATNTAALSPDFNAGQLMRPDVRTRIASALTNALDQADWATYLAYAENGLYSALKLSAAPAREHRFDAILRNDVLSTLLCRSAFIRRVTPAALDSLTSDHRVFLAWLMNTPDAMQDFMLSASPELDAKTVLDTWGNIWKENDDKLTAKYHALALACALVFQHPVNMVDKDAYGYEPVDMLSRFAYFRDANEKHALKNDVADMAAWELCWVVDAHVPNEELDWARQNVNHTQRDMGKAYGDIRYRMDKISKGNSIYKEYTLKEIKKEGGICGDQAHYCSTAAKAHGIPAMVIAGDGDLGGHAWAGYKASTTEWRFDAGRINANYANGGTTDPQTRKNIGEKELAIVADPQRRSEKWLRSYQHIWLADVVAAKGEKTLQAQAYDIALFFSPRNMDAFRTYADFLKLPGTPAELMTDAIREMRVAFRNYPDQLKVADQLETELAYKTADADRASELVRRQARRAEHKFADRTDLFLENLDRQIEALKKAGATNDINKLYREALWDHSDSVVLFRDLVKRYSTYARQQDGLKDAIWYMGNRFKKSHPRPNPSSYFEAMTYAGLMDMFADLYDQVEEKDRAERMRKDADRMREIAAEQTKHERR